jgi:hypothetical protein
LAERPDFRLVPETKLAGSGELGMIGCSPRVEVRLGLTEKQHATRDAA